MSSSFLLSIGSCTHQLISPIVRKFWKGSVTRFSMIISTSVIKRTSHSPTTRRWWTPNCPPNASISGTRNYWRYLPGTSCHCVGGSPLCKDSSRKSIAKIRISHFTTWTSAGEASICLGLGLTAVVLIITSTLQTMWKLKKFLCAIIFCSLMLVCGEVHLFSGNKVGLVRIFASLRKRKNKMSW